MITSLDKKLTASDITLPFVNPATGPIRVVGAKPGDMLTITGEKQEEKEEKKKGYYLSERRFGSFQRSFRLPDDVDVDKIEDLELVRTILAERGSTQAG